MMRKLLILGLLVLAVVVVSCAPPSGDGEGGAFAGQAIRGAQVKANSCDKDAICEVHGLTADDGVTLARVKAGVVNQGQPTVIIDEEKLAVMKEAEFSEEGNFFKGVKVKGGSYIAMLKVGMPNTFEGQPTVFIDQENMIVSKFASFQRANFAEEVMVEDLRVRTLGGEGNAYACLDLRGRLFRSTVICAEAVAPQE